ncbi:MAG: helix-turn-helix domain-containing protein [Anaerolineae bacterium]|nr:helix-turn-helix domain-containing protein [Anaerolineae bacterium]
MEDDPASYYPQSSAASLTGVGGSVRAKQTGQKDSIMTIPEVAEYLKMSRSKVYQLVQKRRIPYVKMGRNVRIKESDLVDWIEEQRQDIAPSPWA